MVKVDLGQCCIDCFYAIETGEGKPVIFQDIAKLKTENEVYSLHTGEQLGFSWKVCDCCKSILGGDRYELFGLKEEGKNNG